MWGPTIYCHIADNLEDFELAHTTMKRDENECRKDFSPEEAVRVGIKIERLEAPKAKARQEATQVKGKTKSGEPNFGPVPENWTEKPVQKRDIAGKAVGMSASSYGRAKAVVVAADKYPEDEVIQEAKKETVQRVT